MLFITMLLFASSNIFAQDTINLKECIDDAIINSPIYKQKEYFSNISVLKISNMQTGYFPQFKFNAQATYQSDVTKINIDLPFPNIEFPSPSKDQYKIAVEANQLIYDGGMIYQNKNIERKDKEINIQQTEIELFKIKELVANLYFTLLLNEKKKELIQIFINEINNRKSFLESNVKNGTLLPVNIDIIRSEELKLQQQLFDINENIKTCFNKLSELTGNSYSNNTFITIPDAQYIVSGNDLRPENKLFDLQIEKLNSTQKLINTQLMPKAFLFSQFGYGKPGLNMLSDKFDSYYILGIGVNWNFFDWNKTKRERQQLIIQQDIIRSQKDNFNRNIEIAIKNQISQIEKIRFLLQTDEELIKIRENITKVSASQLDKGLITSTAYITELNAEKQAKIEYETHKLQIVYETLTLLIMQNLW